MSLSHQLQSSAVFFTSEAMRNSVEAKADPSRWLLATLNLVVGMEHLAKSLLSERHPVFIRESIDRRGRTVGFQQAFERLMDRDIFGLSLSEKDQSRLKDAINARNDIAHGSLENRSSQAQESKFFEIFALSRELFRKHARISLAEHVDRQTYSSMLSMSKALLELEKRANDSLSDFEIVWQCAECSKEFLVVRDEKFLCLFCHAEEDYQECDSCKLPLPASESFEAEEVFEWEFSEGRSSLVDDFGITERVVCDLCFEKLAEYARHAEMEKAYWESDMQFFIERE